MALSLHDDNQGHPRTSQKMRPIPDESKLEEHLQQSLESPVEKTQPQVNIGSTIWPKFIASTDRLTKLSLPF